MADWTAVIVAAIALVVSIVTAVAQYRLGVSQRDVLAEQVALGERTARTEQQLAVAHSGAQTAMQWRDQVLHLHDRGLDPEEIRWIMCCEDGGTGHEEFNGLIDEVVGNVPRLKPGELVPQPSRSDHRRLPRPTGHMRADPGQRYPFPAAHSVSPGD